MKPLYLILGLIFCWCTAYSQDGFIPGEPALAYWEVGDKAEIIIVLHGGPSVQHQYLRPEFDALSEVGKVIYYDQRGCGKSKDAASYIWQEHVKDLKRVIDNFSKGKKVILAGSSWGSLLAIVYAYSHPEDVKGLVLTGTVEWPGKNMDALSFQNYKAKNLNSYEPRTIKFSLKEERILENNANRAGENIVIVEKDLELYTGGYKGEAHFSLMTAPSLEELRKITLPVLIFYGDKSGCNLEDWGYKYAQVFPSADVKIVKEVCHDPWIRDPIYFFAEANKFILSLKQNQKN